jgi:pimeloyl-ACP methyl ester carboxylesterase|tara:strand:- start:889 stop:1767 length:879 start_codon:yes stop_codon:yes gene_type:complete
MERKTYTNTAGEDFSYLAHESHGSKFNFVFFHATGFNAETYQIFFDKLINCFGNQVSIYALDQRGHGLSNAKSDHTQLKSWDIFIDDGKEFIDSIEGSVICSGHSMGSIVAAKISSLNPKKVSHLFMIEPVLYGPLESLKFRFMSMIKYNRGLSIADGAAKRRKEFPSLEDAVTSYTGRGAFTTWTKDWISNYLKGGTRSIESGIELSCSPEWEAATFRSSSMDTWRYLKQIKMKVKVVYGSIGSTFSLQARNSLFKLGSHWDSNYYKDASHFLPMEYPDSVIKDLESYLNN